MKLQKTVIAKDWGVRYQALANSVLDLRQVINWNDFQNKTKAFYSNNMITNW